MLTKDRNILVIIFNVFNVNHIFRGSGVVYALELGIKVR